MIIHLDLDCFFVSAERTRYKPFKGVPAVVANRNDTAIFSPKNKPKAAFTERRGAFSGACYYNKFAGGKSWRDHFIENGKVRGMVVAASYEARALNIRTGTTLHEALRLCPTLQILPGDMPFYHKLSKTIADLLAERIPLLEQFSIDEFFGDLRGWIKDEETDRFIRELKQEVYKTLGLPSTIGASSSKLIAKLAAKSAKPFGTRVVFKEDIPSFIEDKPIEAIMGVGRQTAAYLKRFGVHTLGEALRAPPLLEGLGKNGQKLLRELRGEPSEQVLPESPRKSVGISRVFDPIEDRSEVERRLLILAEHLAFALSQLELEPGSFSFTVGYRSAPSKQVRVSNDRVFSEALLRRAASETFDEIADSCVDAVTYLGVSAGDFHAKRTTTNLLSYKDDLKNRTLNDATQKVRAKYGIDYLRYARDTEPAKRS
jgi:DNA polymerase-4